MDPVEFSSEFYFLVVSVCVSVCLCVLYAAIYLLGLFELNKSLLSALAMMMLFAG